MLRYLEDACSKMLEYYYALPSVSSRHAGLAGPDETPIHSLEKKNHTVIGIAVGIFGDDLSLSFLG